MFQFLKLINKILKKITSTKIVKNVFTGKMSRNVTKGQTRLIKHTRKINISNTVRKVSDKQKKYASLRTKVKNKIEKTRKHEELLHEIANKIGIDPYRLGDQYYGGLMNKTEFNLLKYTYNDIDDRIISLESANKKFDDLFDENGKMVNKNGVWQPNDTMKQKMFKDIAEIVHYDSDEENRLVKDKETSMDVLSDLQSKLGMSDKEAYEKWEYYMYDNRGNLKEDIAFTFDEYLEFKKEI